MPEDLRLVEGTNRGEGAIKVLGDEVPPLGLVAAATRCDVVLGFEHGPVVLDLGKDIKATMPKPPKSQIKVQRDTKP